MWGVKSIDCFFSTLTNKGLMTPVVLLGLMPLHVVLVGKEWVSHLKLEFFYRPSRTVFPNFH